MLSYLYFKLLEKLRQIVVPELKHFFKKLSENPQRLPIECKLQGLPVYDGEDPERMVERLVAVQEYKIRRLLKERLSQDEKFLGEELAQNKDYIVTSQLKSVFRKPLTEYDSSLVDSETLVLTQDQRKPLIEKAIHEMVQAITIVRGEYLKLQQSYLEINEQDIDGKELNEDDIEMLALSKPAIERNKKLIHLASRINTKPDIDFDRLSVDSDDLIPTQDDIGLAGEDLDGIELSESDPLVKELKADEELLTIEINGAKMKSILCRARKRRLVQNKEKAVLALEKKNNSQIKQQIVPEVAYTLEQQLLQVEDELGREKRIFREVYDKLDKHSTSFDRLVRFRKRIEKDLEYFVRELQKTKTLALDKQIQVMRKKLENQLRLNERIKEDFPEVFGERKREEIKQERQRSRSRDRRRFDDRKRRSQDRKRQSDFIF